MSQAFKGEGVYSDYIDQLHEQTVVWNKPNSPNKLVQQQRLHADNEIFHN